MAPTSGDSDASSSLSVDGGYSEYSDDDCPGEVDFIDSENEEDEVIPWRSDKTLRTWVIFFATTVQV